MPANSTPTDIYLRQDKRPWPRQAPDVSGWFDKYKEKYTQAEAEAVLAQVERWAQKHFGTHITMQLKPIGFGRQLLLNVLPDHVHYAQVPDAVGKSIHGMASVPHRIEAFQGATKAYEHDARLAFLSFARRVPVYLADDFIYDTGSDYVPGREAWYRVDVTVPTGWDRIGLVPSRQIDSGEQSTYEYPNAPGTEFNYLLHASEVRLLREYQWPHAIRRRAIFADKDRHEADPLRKWQEILARAIEGADADRRRWGLLRIALANIARHTIGGFLMNGKGNHGKIFDLESHLFVDDKAAPIFGTQLRYYMPHWNAAITARARVATTKLALSVPRAQLVKIVGDAVFTTVPIPGLCDNGKVGCYRLKGVA
jgi:hypothetical protein